MNGFRQLELSIITARLRVELDIRDDKINARVRDAQFEKAPYMLVVGEREIASRAVAVRSHEKGNEGVLPLESVIERLKSESNFDY